MKIVSFVRIVYHKKHCCRYNILHLFYGHESQEVRLITTNKDSVADTRSPH